MSEKRAHRRPAQLRPPGAARSGAARRILDCRGIGTRAERSAPESV